MYKYALIACLATGVILGQESRPDKRLQDATAVVNEMMGMPDKGIPQSVLDKAQCIVVVPGLKKAAFIVGGQFGRGFASCRKAGGWGAPAAMKIEGGSFGLQLGGQSTDVILLVMNQLLVHLYLIRQQQLKGSWSSKFLIKLLYLFIQERQRQQV